MLCLREKENIGKKTKSGLKLGYTKLNRTTLWAHMTHHRLGKQTILGQHLHSPQHQFHFLYTRVIYQSVALPRVHLEAT